MRVYVPATTTTLRELQESGEIASAPLTAFAVTAALREWYLDDDDEELEYAALSEAARGSLRLLDADPSAARRRVVVAVDVADALVEIRDDLDRGVVQVRDAIGLAAVASVHVDDSEAETVVAAAAESIIAADIGDSASQERVDDAEGFELSWYANQEISDVLKGL